jgi:lipopolysaccharide assembly outer membrane protein LptD (OstA)
MKARLRFFVLLAAALATTGGVRATYADGGQSTFGDLQVHSAPDGTEILLELRSKIPEEDRTQRRPGLSASGVPGRVATPAAQPSLAAEETPTPLVEPTPTPTPSGAAPEAEATPTRGGRVRGQVGSVTATEIHLFFPGATIPRSRMISVSDRIIEEARLFPEEGGVSMTVVARRPIYYVVSRTGDELNIHVEPATLLAAEPTGPIAAPETTPVARRGQQRGGGATGIAGGAVQGAELVPKVTMPPLKKGEGLTVDAEHLSADEEKNEIVAKGHVTIARASSLLTADQVRVNRDTQMGEAQGNVVFSDPQGSIDADSFIGNLEDETGELENGTVLLNANKLTITGTKMQKSYGQTYHIENGEFTTCQCGSGAPSWSIAGKSIDITLDGYGLIDDAKFKILDMPILYLPKFSFSAKKTRQTGFLAPLFGYSKKRGFVYTQPFYTVINKSADFTIAPDIETSARVGVINELRYALDDKSKATINVSYFNEIFRSNASRDIVDPNVASTTIPENRWSVTADVRQELPFGIKAFADSLAVSDDFFLREIPTFSFDPDYARSLRTSRYDSTTVGIYRFWDHATLLAQGVYYQDFIQDSNLTLQRLPQIEFFAADRFLDRHLKLGLNSEFDDFVRKQGFDGPRIDINPSIEAPFRWREYVHGTAGLQGRETAYHLNNTDLLLPITEAGGLQNLGTDVQQQQLAKNPSREIYQASGMLATEISRVFDIGGEHVQKLKHTIEPEVDYLYVPDVNQNDLPTYDFVDRINRRNLFTYGFTSRLLAKLDQPPPTERNRPRSVGEMNSFMGVAPSAFDDENTRGGLASLGNPDVSGPTPTGIGARLDETTTATGTEAQEGSTLTPQEIADKRAEERAATSHVQEWVRLQIDQSYDVRDSLQASQTTPGTTTTTQPITASDHFSDIDTHLRLTPQDFFSLLYDGTMNAHDQHLTSASVGFLIRDPRERSSEGILRSAQRASAAVSYRFISGGALEEVDHSALIPLADTISTFYLVRYDALAHSFLEKTGGLRLTSQCQCWIADVLVSNTINPQETLVRFQVTLVGLGSIGRVR